MKKKCAANPRKSYLCRAAKAAKLTEKGCAGAYRFGFNGKEKDSDGEWGNLTHYDYGMRIYNPSIGKFLSVDPFRKNYVSLSPFAYVANNPLIYIDPEGGYILPAKQAENYSVFASYLKNGIGKLLAQPEIRDGLKNIAFFTDEQINDLAVFGKGIEIDIAELHDDAVDLPLGLEINGYTPGNKTIQIDATLAQQLQDASSSEEQQAALLAIVSTMLHETTHQGYRNNPGPGIGRSKTDISNGEFSRKYDPYWGTYEYYYKGEYIGGSSETGDAYENGIWYNGNLIEGAMYDLKQGSQGIEDQKRLILKNKEAGRDNLLPEIEE